MGMAYNSLPDGHVAGVMSMSGKVTMHVVTELYGEACHVVVPLDAEQMDRLIHALHKTGSTVYKTEL